MSKIIAKIPSEELFETLKNNMLDEKVEMFCLSSIAEVRQYAERIRPDIGILYVHHEADDFDDTLTVVRQLSQKGNIIFLLLVDEGVSIEQLRSVLSEQYVFLQKYCGEPREIVFNLKSISNIVRNLGEQNSYHEFEKHFSSCLQIIYQEKDVDSLFERLLNYLPKFILMDYWAMFTIDKKRSRLENFAQFYPPGYHKKTMMATNLQKLVEAWMKKEDQFFIDLDADPLLFQKLKDWGWPIRELYFLPLKYKNITIGAMIIGNSKAKHLTDTEFQFLAKLNRSISDRILNQNLTSEELQDVNLFSDKLISDHLDEESIFQHTCKNLNEMTGAASTIYWQYNKGFGFVFPKYFYFDEHYSAGDSLEKNVIFLEKEKYLNQLIDSDQLQAIELEEAGGKLNVDTRRILEQLQYSHLLILPLKIHQEIFGALIVNKRKTQDEFNIWEIYKAEEVLIRTQKVLEDAQTVKEANLKLRQLARIFELGSEITHDLSLNDILFRIINSLRKALGWNDIAVLIEDESGKMLRVNNKVGFSESFSWEFNLTRPISIRKFNKFLKKCERISNSFAYIGQAQASPNGTVDSEMNYSSEWQRNDLLVIPLETRNRVLGYLLVHDPVDRLKPNVEKIMPLEYYANQAAVAVENSVLYEQLRASQERYRSLAETMSLGLVTASIEGKIVYVNPAFHQLIGYDEKELLEESLINFFAGSSREALQEVIEKLLDKESDERTHLENLEFEILSKEGETIPVSVFGFPFYERREKTGFFLVLSDLRVLKRLERMKADFNSMIVHDLRSPMNVIQGFIELIRNRVVGDINSEQEELLDIAKENVKKVLTLIDNFLIASKLEVGKFSIDAKLAEINPLVEQQVENHKIITKNKNISITLDLDRNLPLLFFDNLRLEQVLNNLLSNAIKFTPENGHIHISSSLEKQEVEGEEQFYACISVKDSGTGIPKGKLKHVFDKYEQVDENQNLNIRGTGLGLSICKDIVNLHGGEIWIESEPNVGSTFSFSLPIEPSIEKIVK